MKIAYSWPERNAYGPRMQSEYAQRVKISLPLHLLRRANLDALAVEAGGVTALADLVQSPRSHISAVISGDKPCGNRLAAKIEQKTSRPAGWLDADHSGTAASALTAQEPAAAYDFARTATVGQVAMQLARALQQLDDERRRDLVAGVIVSMLKGGAGEAEAKAIDTLTGGLIVSAAPERANVAESPPPAAPRPPPSPIVGQIIGRGRRIDDAKGIDGATVPAPKAAKR